MKKFLVLIAIAVSMCTMALSGVSCPPKFFSASDVDSANTNLFAHLSPQKTMPHGRLNAVAKLNGDTVAIISKLGNVNRRLGVFDPAVSDWVYLGDSDTVNDYVADLVRDNHFKVRPAPNNPDSYDDVDIWFSAPNTDKPVLLIDFSDLLVEPTHKIGTIYEITIEGLYGDTAAFKTANTAMSTDDRIFHVRWGDTGDTIAPTIEATNFPAEGDTVDLDFNPEITFSEEMGFMYVWLYSGETSSGNTIEVTDFWPVPIDEQLRDIDSGDVKYTMGGRSGFGYWDSNTLYHLFLVAEVEAAAGDIFGMLGDMSATQDLNGNRVTCPTGTEVDPGTYTGGNALNVKACVGRFLTK